MKRNFFISLFLQTLIALGLIALYVLIALSCAKADTKKIGEGNFVMAVSYTESYKDLHYVANFSTCSDAQAYYDSNCIGAMIMMCQAEDRMYMPVDHNSNNTFSSFDFEIDTKQSCGFVGVDPKFTGVE
jgi:hypothetical protein